MTIKVNTHCAICTHSSVSSSMCHSLPPCQTHTQINTPHNHKETNSSTLSEILPRLVCLVAYSTWITVSV